MSGRQPARKLVDGQPGDKYEVAARYEGTWEKAVGVPLQDQKCGEAKDIPRASKNVTSCTGPPHLVVVELPDFNIVDKNDKVFPTTNKYHYSYFCLR